MADKLLLPVAVAAFFFLTVRSVFAILDWWYPEELGGPSLAGALNGAWDFVHANSILSIAQHVSRRFVQGYSRAVFGRRSGLLWYSVVSLVVNLWSWVLIAGYIVFDNISWLPEKTLSAVLREIFSFNGFVPFGTVVVIGSIAGVVIDIIAAFVTRRHLSHVVQAGLTRATILNSLLVEVLLMVGFACANLALGLGIMVVSGAIAEHQTIQLLRITWKDLLDILSNLNYPIQYTDGWAIPIWLVSASLPTAIGLSVVVLAIVASRIPDRARETIVKAILLVASDRESLLKRLGAICGSLAALLSGLLTLIATMKS